MLYAEISLAYIYMSLHRCSLWYLGDDHFQDKKDNNRYCLIGQVKTYPSPSYIGTWVPGSVSGIQVVVTQTHRGWGSDAMLEKGSPGRVPGPRSQSSVFWKSSRSSPSMTFMQYWIYELRWVGSPCLEVKWFWSNPYSYPTLKWRGSISISW